MEFSQWEKYYEQILLDFGYERAKDDEAAAVLEDVSTGRNLASVGELKEHLVGKIVHVFGDGPSLPMTSTARSSPPTVPRPRSWQRASCPTSSSPTSTARSRTR
jgi:uncharacterized Rossmann fold enzyme